MKERVKNQKRTILRILLLLLAVGMIAAGAVRKEHETVFQKAVNICLECIGVG